MEEATSHPGLPGDRAQVAAEKLRALRERANQALGDHRKRLAQIETELSDRVRQLAEEFEHAAEGIERHLPGSRDAEVAALREQLEENRAKHEKFVEQLAIARKQIDAIQSQTCPTCEEATHQLAEAQAELRPLREQIELLERQRQEDRARNEKVAEQVAAARQAIGDLQTRSGEQVGQLQAELDAALAAKAAAEEQAASLARDIELLHAEYEQLASKSSSLESDLATAAAVEAEAAAARTQIAQLQQQVEQSATALAEAERRYQAAQQSAETLAKEKSSLQGQVDALQAAHAADLESLTARVTAAEQEASQLREQVNLDDAETSTLKARLADAVAARDEYEMAVESAHAHIDALEQEAAASVPELERQFAEFQAAVDAAEQSRAALMATLDAKTAEITALRETTCPRADLDALQHKFGVTLSEVQKLKRENGELREQLAARPAGGDQTEPSEQVAAELLSLRAECATLTARVAELESTPPPEPPPAQPDPELQQQVEDLQQRFETTLEDLREARQVNQSLRDQLASAQTTVVAAVSGGSDWASQRARLMAMLEDEECEGIEATRQKERATIEETITATDRALAEKERELAELRAAGGNAIRSTEEEELRIRLAAIDADESIAQEREKLTKLQQEWEEKLRAAELEVSIERAKLAREQAALKERMFELEKLAPQAGAAVDADGKPRRRWLAALGLGEEGEEAKK